MIIPLHLNSTTVHVRPDQAERLVEARLAEWLDIPVPALRLRGSLEAEADVLALLV